MEPLSAEQLRGLFDQQAWTLMGVPIEAAILIVSGQYLLRYRDGAKERMKFVESAALREAFSNEPVDSGWIEQGIVRLGSGTQGNWSVKWVAPATHVVNVNGEELTVPLPGIVIVAGARDGARLFALAEREFSPQAQLYHMPLPNCYTDGRVCWGLNQPPGASAATAWQLFLQSPFNGDLAGGRSMKYRNDVRAGLVKLAQENAKRYPTNDLVRCGEFADVNDVLKTLLGVAR